MVEPVQHRAEPLDGEGNPGRGFVVDDAKRLEAPLPVGCERRLDRRERRAPAPVGRDGAHLDPEPSRHRRPGFGEIARLDHQDLIAGGEEVAQRRMPRPVPRGGVEEDLPLRLTEHAGKPRPPAFIDRHEGRIVEVDRGMGGGEQDGIGDVGRAGIGEEMAATGRRQGGHLGLHSHSMVAGGLLVMS